MGMIIPYKKPPNGEPGEAAKEANRSISRIRRAGRADHRPHQDLENPPAPTTGAPCTHSNYTRDHVYDPPRAAFDSHFDNR